jgi:hypothetical protein
MPTCDRMLCFGNINAETSQMDCICLGFAFHVTALTTLIHRVTYLNWVESFLFISRNLDNTQRDLRY